ncbi:MAG: PIG-L family deacetylase, partial [Candidatus Hodarchaeales archaeon]
MIVKGICHVHSQHSYDGTLDLDELKNIYEKKGFNFMLLTEHAEKGMTETRYDQIKNECKKLSKNKFILIPGLEYISYQSYHILAIGLNHYKDLNKKDTKYILNEVKKSGGLSIVAHPVRYGHRISKAIIPFIDGIEIWNTSYDGITQVKKNIKLFKSSLGYNQNLICVGGMDLHLYDTKENIVYFYMPSVPHLSKDEIFSSLKNGQFEVRSDIYSISSTGNISVQNRKRFLVKSLSNVYIDLIRSAVHILEKTKTKKVFDILFSSQMLITNPKIENIESANVLILAPHPDDDVIGCGGTICKHIKNKSEVKVVYMTDGRMSKQNIPINELIHIRKEEAKNALGVL